MVTAHAPPARLDPALLAKVTMLVAAATCMCGCAVGRFGTLAANVQRRGDVSHIEVYSVGLYLRTRADDRGAHLGFSKRTYTFASAAMPRPGWYFLRVPLPERAALAQDLTTVGIDLSTAAPVAGLSLGYVHTQLFARIPMDASVQIQFSSDLRIDKFLSLEETLPCAIP